MPKSMIGWPFQVSQKKKCLGEAWGWRGGSWTPTFPGLTPGVTHLAKVPGEFVIEPPPWAKSCPRNPGNVFKVIACAISHNTCIR